MHSIEPMVLAVLVTTLNDDIATTVLNATTVSNATGVSNATTA